ncbi:MAG: hypothetical protein ABIQ04_01435 [Candidatus Saccharimonadales bacterium]
MKKLIIISVSIVAIPLIAFGTIKALDLLAPHSPLVDDSSNTVAEMKPADSTSPPKTQPTVQNAATDTIIQSDMKRITTLLESYSSDNNGKYPATEAEIATFQNKYMEGLAYPVTHKPYTLSSVVSDGFTSVIYRRGYICVGDRDVQLSTNSRQFALQIPLTSGKDYCADNS